MMKILAFAALMLVGPFQAAAVPAANDPAITQRTEDRIVRFINTGMREGLANASVSSMVQDEAGFIWIGTQGGLHRWDGKSFHLYENEPFDPASLPHNLIQTMYMDEDGHTIWIGTYGGLARFDSRTGVFRSWLHDKSDPDSLVYDVVVSIAKDASGRLWVGTLNGLDRMDDDGKGFRHFKSNPSESGSLASKTIRSLFKDSRGDFWVGTSGGGLCRYLPASDTFEIIRADPAKPDGLQSDYVFSIKEDAEGALWLGLWNFGVSKFDPVTGRFTGFRLDDGRVYFVNADEKGIVRAGTWGGGLFELFTETGTISRYRSDSDRTWSLPHDTIYSMLVDRDGNPWIGTNGGGFSLLARDSDAYTIIEYDPKDPASRSSGKTTSVLEDSKNRLWIGVYNNGLDRLDPGAKGFRHYRFDPKDARSLPNDIVPKLYEDTRGTIWAMTNGGLARYDEASDSFDRFLPDPANPDAIADSILYDMVEEIGTDNYWIATYTRGVEYWDRSANRFIHYPSVQDDPGSPSDNLVYSLAYDGAGRLWVATNGGLSRYAGGGRFVRYDSSPKDPTSLPSMIVRDLFVDSTGKLWLATNGGGVARYEESTDSFSHWTKKNGLPSNIVLGLLEGEPGTIWASTTTGVAILERTSGRWRPFSDQSRLRYGEFTAGRFKSASGVLYFGAMNALYIIDPRKVSYSSKAPPVRITSIKIQNKELESSLAPWFVRDLRVKWNEASLSLNFAAMDYSDPLRVQYAYRLEGFDDDWVFAGSRSYASYTNLRGGREYVFKVKAANGVGEWAEEATGLRIKVDPMPWASWWAIALYTVFGVAIIWVLSVVRSRVLLRGEVNELSRLKSQLEQANARLEVLAAHDGLTGVLNRRSLDVELSRRFLTASRLAEPVSVLMVDIDFFKPYNDKYGHQAGDETLITVSAAIAKALTRPQDTLARYGGEEFAAILPGTDISGARRVAERIRAAVESLGVTHETSSVVPVVTVSVGYASTIPAIGETPARLVGLADEALFRAKDAGRNRISA